MPLSELPHQVTHTYCVCAVDVFYVLETKDAVILIEQLNNNKTSSPRGNDRSPESQQVIKIL